MSRRDRIGWDQYFLEICHAIAMRSIDEDTQNGSVIVTARHRVVSTGYNGFPAGVDDTFWPNQRGQTVKVLKVGASREFNGKPNSLESSQAPSCYWIDKDQYYNVDKYMAIEHAESNAIVSAGQDLHDCIIYTQLFPCHNCAKLIITAGITKVVYVETREDISWAVAKELFIQRGVELVEWHTP